MCGDQILVMSENELFVFIPADKMSFSSPNTAKARYKESNFVDGGDNQQRE